MTSRSKDNGTQSRGLRGGWRRFAFVVAALAAVWAVASYAWPLLDPHWAQDRCSFGEVTNARYLELLQAATPLAETDRPAFEHAVAYGGDIAKILQNEFDAISARMTSIKERIAAMHALNRAHGAEYLASVPDEADPFSSDRSSHLMMIEFYYRFDMNKYGLLRPMYRWGYIRVDYSIEKPISGYTSLLEGKDKFLFAVGVANILEGQQPPVLPSVVHPDCPPAPRN